MELFPELTFTWLNGGLFILALGLTEGTMFLIYRKDVKRLFDRSGWTKKQTIHTVLGKIIALASIILLLFSPLKTGSAVFIVGLVLGLIGMYGMVSAITEFAHTPDDQPASGGVYKLTRHPQNLSASLMFLGGCIAVGSWTAIILLILARILGDQNLEAEEEICLKAYGETYRSYMNKVPRYPFLKP